MSEAAEKKQQTTKKAAVKESPPKQGSVMYIGPDIPGAKQNTVFHNGLPDVLKEKVKEHPVFRSMIIPVEKLAQARMELETEGSALYVLYRKAQNAGRKEK